MKTLIETLCGKLEDWGIDPITLVKAIGIFIALIIVVILMTTIPVLFIILLITAICVVMIVLIYTMIE